MRNLKLVPKVKPYKVLTISEALKISYPDMVELPIGTRFKTTEWYTGGDDKDGLPLTGTIIGLTGDDLSKPPKYEVNEQLAETHHQVYRVQLDDGKETVMWPEEVERV